MRKQAETGPGQFPAPVHARLAPCPAADGVTLRTMPGETPPLRSLRKRTQNIFLEQSRLPRDQSDLAMSERVIPCPDHWRALALWLKPG
jgi:hypothetical protein